jgi:hypothetical protein
MADKSTIPFGPSGAGGAGASQQASISNRMAWRGQAGHYEVWFITLVHRATQTGFWLRYTLESPDPAHGAPYAELWFARCDGRDAGRNFGFHRRFPISALESQQQPFALRIRDTASDAFGDAELGPDRASGRMATAAHSVRWDLQWHPAPRTHYLLPRSLYNDPLHIAETLVLSPNHSVYASGSIEVDGEIYDIQDAPAGQSHIWGRKHAYAWGWGRCNAFDKELVPGRTAKDPPSERPLTRPSPAVLEALTVRMRRGPVVLPLTLISVYPDGLDGDELAFKDFSDLVLTRSDFRTGSYTLAARGLTTRIEAQFSCTADDMIRTEYVDPDGAPAYNHFAGAASCRLVLSRRIGPGAPWRTIKELRTDRGAQFEWAGRAGDSLVKKQHVLIK